MQTVTLNIPDNHFETVMTIIRNLKDNLIAHYEIAHVSDPYYEERRKHLQHVHTQLETGQMPAHDFESSIQELMAELDA